MVGLQCNKFREDKGKVILVLLIKVMLLVLGEEMQVDRKGLLNATIVKVNDTWLGNALSLSDQGWLKLKKLDKVLNEEQLAFLVDPGILDGQAVQTIIPNNAAFQTEDLDTYDSDLTAELERYKERVKTFEQRLNIDLSSREKMIDSQIDEMIKEKLALKEQVDSVEENLSK
ncbi:hypothetical protein Tco_0494626 [Tanacetum coccineum]